LLTVTPHGEPIGLLDAQCWAVTRPVWKFPTPPSATAGGQGKSQMGAQLAGLQQAAAQTPQSQWVMLADREADLYELFETATTVTARQGKLRWWYRAHHDRRLASRHRSLLLI